MTAPAVPQTDDCFSGWAVASTTDAFPQPGRAPMGRHVAGDGFLKGISRHGFDAPITGFGDPREKDAFIARIRASDPQAKTAFIDHRFPEQLADPGHLITHAPDLAVRAWHRSRRAPDAYSLIGVTHSLSGSLVREAICGMTSAPVAGHDALVCTSRAARDVVTRLLDAQEEDLRQRLGATRFSRPHLPIIPLGIETGRLSPEYPQNQALRARERERLGLSDDDVLVLSVGRLDPLTKAYPMPLLVALARVAEAGRVTLLMAGSSPPQAPGAAGDTGAVTAHLQETARAIDPRLRIEVRPDLPAEDMRACYAAADIFVSLSDNIQETFGIAVVEAMAAGLPVVVSDWSGYRDLVRDGIDGYRIPTRIPPESFSERVAGLYEAHQIGYREYVGAIAALTVVDIDATAERIGALSADRNLRARMGESGRARAVAEYDWGRVIAQYRDLICACAERRKAINSPRRAAPAHPSPFGLFGDFSGTRLEMTTLVAPGDVELIEAARMQPAPLCAYYGTQAVAILNRLGSEPVPLSDILGRCREFEPGRVTASVMALAKIGALRLK
ncbi:MAG: glycosyltransferase family 4 protein [Salinarimonas sp.]|nr:glycosyltransferase family 4 protein [Salinarimonas sp.]